MGNGENDGQPVIETQGIEVVADGFCILEALNHTIPAGAVVAILGPNGAGKSTYLKVLLGLVTPTNGSALVFGHPPGKAPPSWIGYVPQIKTLDRAFPARSCELVVNGLRGRWPWRITPAEHDAAMAELARVGAAQVAHRPLAALSGGELQRVYLARALVRRPKLVLLDEPAAGIDVTGELDLYRVLEHYHHDTGATILMITHDWATAAHHASHALLINRRQICFAPSQVALTDENLRQAFGHAQHDHLMHLGKDSDA